MISRIPSRRAVLATSSPLGRLSRKWLSTSATSIPSNTCPSPIKAYISTSNDPFLNLSIEHHLLQTSPPDSAVLFLYKNRPSIIIGRNQNPWLEVNLALLNATPRNHNGNPLPETGLDAPVDLVRRRSGGGTVFHDQGNVNWTVICPSSIFTRDKHAEMVVRALRSNGVDRARVNERHDVVLDQGQKRLSDLPDPDDTHATPYQTPSLQALKVSGSAYKLTRARALHHGTCLLSSPNLNVIPHYLHSPAKSFITAKGVESVSSPVGNILLENERFEASVRKYFAEMYSEPEDGVVEVGESWAEVEGVQKGMDELKVCSHVMRVVCWHNNLQECTNSSSQSLEWTYLQTPQFAFSSHSNTTDHSVPLIEFTARFGVITECNIQLTPASHSIGGDLIGKRLHEITNWRSLLPQPQSPEQQLKWKAAIEHLERVLPRVETAHN
jgi:lipoate-protein ligase A